jgi:hypothetical protein
MEALIQAIQRTRIDVPVRTIVGYGYGISSRYRDGIVESISDIAVLEILKSSETHTYLWVSRVNPFTSATPTQQLPK